MENYNRNNKDMEEDKVYFQNVPIGAVMAFAMKDAPVGWLVCDGEMYSKELFPLLSEALGTTYNHPDTPGGFFCVPDLQGLFVRGWDRDSEREFGSVQKDALQGHSHFFDVKGVAITIQEDGSHYHPLWCNEYDTVTSVSGLAGSSKSKRMCYPSNSSSDGATDLGPSAGKHSHTASILVENNPIREVSVSKYGIPEIDVETRPKNIALLYCIKAENLPATDSLTETGYSTIVERVKKELMGTIVPLCRTLPIVTIGGDEYLANVEKIKQSHFFRHPTNRQDLVYATAQCFNDICVYNVRNGQRSEQFDAFGLDLLVSWIIDKGMLAQKEKLLFIEEVKNYISSLLLAITPK